LIVRTIIKPILAIDIHTA